MTWLRRAQESAHERVNDARDGLRPDTDPGDSPAAMRAVLSELVREVNRDAGLLPVRAVATARRVLDAVREELDAAPDHPLDVHAVIAVRGILEDYLPTTLRRFVALDPAQVDVERPSGRTPTASLLDQLDALEQAAVELLEATRAQDADALLTQGSFLHTKFTRSDLDL